MIPLQIYDYDSRNNKFNFCSLKYKGCKKKADMFCASCDHAVCESCHNSARYLREHFKYVMPLNQAKSYCEVKRIEKLEELKSNISDIQDIPHKINEIKHKIASIDKKETLNPKDVAIIEASKNIKQFTNSLEGLENMVLIMKKDLTNYYYSRNYYDYFPK